MVKISSHLLEIINKNIDFQKNYIEFELLDTNFANFAKYISPIAINVENEVTGAELSTVALVELLQELSEINLKLKLYEDEITAYAATINQTITFERLEYPDFSEMVEAEKVANYEVLKWFVERALDIRKRMIITRKVLGDMAALQLMKDFSIKPSNFGAIAGGDDAEYGNTISYLYNYGGLAGIHPGLNIALFTKNVKTDYTGTAMVYDSYLVAVKLDANFNLVEKLGEYKASKGKDFVYGWGTGLKAEFTPLGDAVVINNKILDFAEYGLALSPNWQGVTLDIIESRG